MTPEQEKERVIEAAREVRRVFNEGTFEDMQHELLLLDHAIDAHDRAEAAKDAPPAVKRDNGEVASPDDIREHGWMVAVHNDYKMNGQRFTFWLFVKDGRAVKGEGATDSEALNLVRKQIFPVTTADDVCECGHGRYQHPVIESEFGCGVCGCDKFRLKQKARE